MRTFYTAPTLIRALEAAGDKFATEHKLSSLKVLGTVGEPINAKAWNWYNKVIGGGKCPIVDTWWQTETGSILLTPLPGAWNLKPGSATLPFFGVQPVLLDEKVSQHNHIYQCVPYLLCLSDLHHLWSLTTRKFTVIISHCTAARLVQSMPSHQRWDNKMLH